ncbi:hypothetical protein GBA52_005719 [Prunus armeniaca]|nr:hypothetical protein GBA52_005719 [Prunus armeniaca]
MQQLNNCVMNRDTKGSTDQSKLEFPYEFELESQSPSSSTRHRYCPSEILTFAWPLLIGSPHTCIVMYVAMVHTCLALSLALGYYEKPRNSSASSRESWRSYCSNLGGE